MADNFQSDLMDGHGETLIFVDGTVELASQELNAIQNPPHASTQETNETEEETVDETSSRKSRRLKKEKRSYSPTLVTDGAAGKKRKRRKIVRADDSPSKVFVRPYDKLADGSQFSCDLCKSPYVCNPGRRGNQHKVSKHTPLPRHKVDPNTGKTFILCNACGIAFDRPRKVSKAKPPPTAAEKAKYLDEARTFAMSLVEGLNDPDAERLSCPYITSKPCACMQQYIIGNGDMEGSRNRASELLGLLKEAKRLITQKSYAVDDEIPTKGKRRMHIGLGNGHKRSKAYEEFVLKNRKYLRDELKLCEQATQKVLLYSNNFLHKRLKTEMRKRRVLSKGKSALGLLTPIKELHTEKCCIDNCVMICLTHGNLLQHWRDRVKKSQLEARVVLAEMLTPSGGARTNCYKFISWVTGCSHSTISRVSEQMRRTCGDRTPPEHGLKKYWLKQKAKKALEAPVVPTPPVAVIESPLANAVPSDGNNVPLHVQRQHLLNLQRQITQQQLQLQHQQHLLQQSLGHADPLMQVHNNSSAIVPAPAPPIPNCSTEIRQPAGLLTHIPDYSASTLTPALTPVNIALVQENDTDQVWNTQTISIGNINYTVVIQPTGETTLLSVNPSSTTLETPLIESQCPEETDSSNEQSLSNDMVLLLGQHGINVISDKN